MGYLCPDRHAKRPRGRQWQSVWLGGPPPVAVSSDHYLLMQCLRSFSVVLLLNDIVDSIHYLLMHQLHCRCRKLGCSPNSKFSATAALRAGARPL
jgi:hypothetical protein